MDDDDAFKANLAKILDGGVKPKFEGKRKTIPRRESDPWQRLQEIAKARLRFAYGVMIVAVFGMASAGLPLPTAPAYRAILAVCSMVTLIVGACYYQSANGLFSKISGRRRNGTQDGTRGNSH